MRTHSHAHSNYEANGRANDFAMAWILIGSALKAHDGKWHEVTHLEGIERGQI